MQGPLLQCGNEGILREFLGDADITNHAGQSGDELGGFDSPYGVDRAMCVGSGQRYRSNHLSTAAASAVCEAVRSMRHQAGGLNHPADFDFTPPVTSRKRFAALTASSLDGSLKMVDEHTERE